MKFPTSQEILNYRDMYQVSMQEASRAVFGVHLLEAVNNAQTIEDIKEILVFMVGNNNLY